jgi:hypothetical protein
MRTLPQSTRIIIWVFVGVILTLTAIALTIPAAPLQNSATAGAMIQAATPTTEVPSEVGSTDGVVLIAVVIVLVILIPILFRWKDWTTNAK